MKHGVIFLLLAAVIATPAWAANDSREKQMLRRMQQQIQQTELARAQAEQEKTAALADKAAAEHKLEKLDATQRQLASERMRTEAELKTSQAEGEALKARLADTEKKLADSVALQRTTAEKLAQTESVKKQAEGQLADSRQDLKLCQTHNGSLYALGREMMDKYRDKSCQDALAQAEPFTGLKKIEVENLLETWRDQLDREKLSASGQR
jgi:hypothetical protein